MTTEEKGFSFRTSYTVIEFPNGDNDDYNITPLHFDTLALAVEYAKRRNLPRYQILESKIVVSVWKDEK